ncbi:MAG: carboxypeptidase regulatory-like domain-containing protein [Fibromonadaceae bacterium]|nr:carboxypeptidase regulatory-like domain-containing protein [Fibromonadaceae bacterium]
MSAGKEERIAGVIGKAGMFGGIGSLIIIAAVAASAVLTGLMNVKIKFLFIIVQWGPGIASVLGGASSFATYYGWFRILRKKKKLSAREEGKNEAQNQLADFIQSLPDMFGSMSSGCFSQVSTVALGASLVASTAVYTPVVEIVTEKVKSVVEERRVREPSPPLIEEKMETEEKESLPQEEEESVLNITGKLNISSKGGEAIETGEVLTGRRGGFSATIELLREGAVVATTESDTEGNYAFMNMPPGEYSVRAKLDGYREIHRETQEKWDLEMVPVDECAGENVVNIPVELLDILKLSHFTSSNIGGKYTIQLRLLDSRQEAEKIVKDYAEKGVETHIEKIEDPVGLEKDKYRVRTGCLTSVSDSKTYALKKELKGYYVAKPYVPIVPVAAVPFMQTPVLAEEQIPLPMQVPMPIEQVSAPPQLQEMPQSQKSIAHQEMAKQEKPSGGPIFFAGLGSELNNNAKKGTAIGNNMALGFDMNKHFALGVNAIYSSDMDSKESTMESTVMLRYYLPVEGPFLQAEAGGSLSKSEKNSLAPQGGMAAGWRLSVDKDWYLEPAVRGNYPSTWGTGVTVGKKFSPPP